MLKEFRDFLFRGNIVELAVAFVMGLAFAAVVNSLVEQPRSCPIVADDHRQAGLPRPRRSRSTTRCFATARSSRTSSIAWRSRRRCSSSS